MSKSVPKLCLIDASGYIHRAYHALPLLTTSKGEPVNAVYGFSRMLTKVLKAEKPDYLAVCFDTPQPTFRHAMYSEYKGTRTETENSLLVQLPVAELLAEAWGLPCLKKDGFEADDVIATLAVQGRDRGWDVLILSGDKDILQLVDDRIRVRDEIRKVEFDAAKVFEKFGVTPTQLVDYFSLLGDKIDNVVGVPGVGEKTAVKIISQHGTLETLFKNMNGSSDPLNLKLKQYKDVILRNRVLVTLKSDVPLDATVERLTIGSANLEVLTPLVQRLEFKTDLYGVENRDLETTVFNSNRAVELVLNETQLEALKKAITGVKTISYDLETDSVRHQSCGIVGVALSVRPEEAWYIPVGHAYLSVPPQLSWEKVKEVIRPVLEDPAVLKVGQNLKFDDAILRRCGVNVQGKAFDTMIAAYCIDPSRPSFGLKTLASEFLNERMVTFEELVGKKYLSIAEVAVEEAASYSGADAEVSLKLKEIFEKKMDELGVRDLFETLEMPLVPVLEQMESTGIRVDTAYLSEVRSKFEQKRKTLEKEIFDIAGEEFTLNSPAQLSRILFEKLKLPPGKKNKTCYSTDESVISKLAANYPICEKILSYRELAKLISTYVDALLEMADPQTQRVHTSFHQTGTTTGRLSSNSPNLQNIPIRSEQGREIRRAFVASPGNVLVSADYSQIDLRALAHMSGDDVLVDTFKQGGDVHTRTAAEMFHVAPEAVTPDMRRSAKAINFGIVYGQQAWGLSQTLRIDVEEAQAFITKYFERYAGVKRWIEQTLAEVRVSGVATTLAGRRRKIDGINAENGSVRGFAERIAINTPIQGTSADIIKAAMIHLHQALKVSGRKSKMLVQVHDELLFDVPKTELKEMIPVIRRGMEQAFTLRVPLVADIKVGENWNDMEKS